MENHLVSNNEILYRCVFYGKNYYQIQGNRANVSSQAFTDRNKRPSVNRACLCGDNPCLSQKDEKDAVVSLLAKDVRSIDQVVQNNHKGELKYIYKIDVLPRPLEENIAHAQIEPSPEYENDRPFKKLLERLAYLANQRQWEIKPYELRELEK